MDSFWSSHNFLAKTSTGKTLRNVIFSQTGLTETGRTSCCRAALGQQAQHSIRFLNQRLDLVFWRGSTHKPKTEETQGVLATLNVALFTFVQRGQNTGAFPVCSERRDVFSQLQPQISQRGLAVRLQTCRQHGGPFHSRLTCSNSDLSEPAEQALLSSHDKIHSYGKSWF